jgi:hypothetical protein
MSLFPAKKRTLAVGIFEVNRYSLSQHQNERRKPLSFFKKLKCLIELRADPRDLALIDKFN